MRVVLPLLTKSFSKVAKQSHGYKTPDASKVQASLDQRGQAAQVPDQPTSKEITHAWMWPRMGKVGELACPITTLYTTMLVPY